MTRPRSASTWRAATRELAASAHGRARRSRAGPARLPRRRRARRDPGPLPPPPPLRRPTHYRSGCMNADDRRRFGAVAALVLGLFAALSLIPGLPTGPAGEGLGAFLWQGLGVGALGPAAARLRGRTRGIRSPAAARHEASRHPGGRSVGAGALHHRRHRRRSKPDAFLPPLAGVASSGAAHRARAGVLARAVSGVVGQLGGVLIGFLALTALTLATIAWHPLQRLERGAADDPSARPARDARRRNGLKGREEDAVEEDEEDFEEDAPAPVRPARPSARPKSVRPAGKELPPRVVPGRSRGAAAAHRPADAAAASRTPRRTRPRSIGWASSCSRRCGPSRSKAPSPGAPAGRW